MLQKNSLEGPLELAAELPAEIPWFSALTLRLPLLRGRSRWAVVNAAPAA